jgi:hypothetical protein
MDMATNHKILFKTCFAVIEFAPKGESGVEGKKITTRERK